MVRSAVNNRIHLRGNAACLPKRCRSPDLQRIKAFRWGSRGWIAISTFAFQRTDRSVCHGGQVNLWPARGLCSRSGLSVTHLAQCLAWYFSRSVHNSGSWHAEGENKKKCVLNGKQLASRRKHHDQYPVTADNGTDRGFVPQPVCRRGKTRDVELTFRTDGSARFSRLNRGGFV